MFKRTRFLFSTITQCCTIKILRYIFQKENCIQLKKFFLCFRIAELACESSQKLAENVVNLQFMVEEKERAIGVVKQALEHQRKLSANFSQKFQRELNQRLAAQKTEYEATIHRHQNFVDQVQESIEFFEIAFWPASKFCLFAPEINYV